MDQKIISGGSVATIIICLFVALLTLPLGIGAVASYPNEIWPIGLLFLACSGLMVFASINTYTKMKRRDRKAIQDLQEIQQQLYTQTNTTIAKKSIVFEKPIADKEVIATTEKQEEKAITILAHWKYTTQEWQRFIKWEKSRRATSTTVETFVLIIVGTVLIKYTKDESWQVALVISGVVAAIYWIGKYFLSVASIGKSKQANEVVITDTAVIINGKYNPFENDHYWHGETTILGEEEYPVLEINYRWKTRRGSTFDEIRVPIPTTKIKEAKKIVEQLNKEDITPTEEQTKT